MFALPLLVAVFVGIFALVADETPLWKCAVLGLGALCVYLSLNFGIIGFLALIAWDIGMLVYLKAEGFLP